MDILFKRIEFQNFLSFGDVPTTIEIENARSTLVTGNNYSGKSGCLLDTITFALFGKSFRQINKPMLVNSINNKNCRVSIEFTKAGQEFRVVRGIKPNLFEIYKNGSLLDVLSSSVDQQAEFEKTILNFNFATFQQIVVLGSANFVPFLRLKPSDRRLIVDDILNLNVFTKMLEILKSEVSETKLRIQDVENSIFLKESLLEQKISFLKQLQEIGAGIDHDKIKLMVQQQEKLEQKLKQNQQKMKGFQIQEEVSTDNIERYISRCKTIKAKISSNIENLQHTIDFLSTHTNCPTCEQEIEKSFRENKIKEINSNIEPKNEGVRELVKKIRNLQDEKKQIQDKNSENAEKQIAFRELEFERKMLFQKINTIKEHIKETNNNQIDPETMNVVKSEIDCLNVDVNELKQELNKLKDEQEIQNSCSVLLKDTGIKASIIDNYLDILNKTIETYLNRFGLNFQFRLDRNFKEQILNFSGHEFSYFSLSEGEKLRVDLATMFAWKTLAGKRAKMKTNLLILDEVMDGAADGNLQRELLDVLNEMENSNVFVISHRSEGLLDKFDRNLLITRKKGFSYISEVKI